MALKKKYKFLIILLIIVAIGVLFYTFFIQIRHIKPGEIGIAASIGSPIDNNAKHEIEIVRGYVVFLPLYTEFVSYPTTVQTVSLDRFSGTTQDGMPFFVKPTISYQIDENKVDLLYRTTHASLHNFNRTFLKELVTSIYDTTLSSFSSDSLVENRQQFDKMLNSVLSEKIGKIGLELKNITSNMEYPKLIEDAVELRAQSLQNSLVAESRFREIEALRKEDSLRYSALTPLAIQKMFIEKWDGKMPAYGGEIPRIYDNIAIRK